jgi:hypothetical protein
MFVPCDVTDIPQLKNSIAGVEQAPGPGADQQRSQ